MGRSCIGFCALAVWVTCACVNGQVVGWRGNWTGLWPDAQTPTEWSRIPDGILNDLRCTTTRPVNATADSAAPVQNALIEDWIVIGPFAVKDPVAEFDQPHLSDEVNVQPSGGEQVGQLRWRFIKNQVWGRWSFGEADLEWLDVGKAIGAEPNQIAYAHTYLHASKPGRLRAVVDHTFGMKIWVNGKLVYAKPKFDVGFGGYQQMSYSRLANTVPHSASFEFDVVKGWNRILVKICSGKNEGDNAMKFALRLGDIDSVQYKSKNIRWMSPLPDRSNSTPIIVGDRIFLMAEPDELICFDRATGKRLWSAMNNYYEATSRAERDANPKLKSDIDPLVGMLTNETDYEKKLALRQKIQKALVAIDKKKFDYKLDGHLAGHFGIVGFTTPTPCSDGRYVYVWCGNGVAACYDLDGRRRWITRVDAGKLFYASSPALIGDKFVVYMNKLIALDAATGAVAWNQPEVNKNNGSVLPAKLAGVEVIISQQGEVVRASDGHMLYANPDKTSGDSGWAAPVCLGDTLYLPWYGVTHFVVLDFSKCTGESWQPARYTISDLAVSRKPDGSWVDRYTPASPLVYDGMLYDIDIYATFYAVDLNARKLAYRHDVDYHGMFHYNAVPFAASPALIGKYIYVMDNQGTTFVIKPGRQFKLIGKNKIATQIHREIPIRPQETIAYAPIVTDGRYLYIRGENYLYCIGAE